MKMIKIKICGITSPEDAVMVQSTGADILGVIVDVDVSTPREIEVSRAREVFGALSDDVEKVVVTMPGGSEDIEKLSESLSPDYFQIHSDLPSSELKRIRNRVDEGIIGVVQIPKGSPDPEGVREKAEKVVEASDFLLLDTKEESREGAGTVHDWSISSRVTRLLDLPVILAGGLDPSNVRRAVEEVGPFAVDVASGVESEPGRKDKKLVESFVQEAGC